MGEREEEWSHHALAYLGQEQPAPFITLLSHVEGRSSKTARNNIYTCWSPSQLGGSSATHCLLSSNCCNLYITLGDVRFVRLHSHHYIYLSK